MRDMIDKVEELDYEPEWCEECAMRAEEGGIEYEFNYYIIEGQAYCEHCQKSI